MRDAQHRFFERKRFGQWTGTWVFTARDKLIDRPMVPGIIHGDFRRFGGGRVGFATDLNSEIGRVLLISRFVLPDPVERAE